MPQCAEHVFTGQAGDGDCLQQRPPQRIARDHVRRPEQEVPAVASRSLARRGDELADFAADFDQAPGRQADFEGSNPALTQRVGRPGAGGCLRFGRQLVDPQLVQRPAEQLARIVVAVDGERLERVDQRQRLATQGYLCGSGATQCRRAGRLRAQRLAEAVQRRLEAIQREQGPALRDQDRGRIASACA
jgi:hypothetical protein